MDFVKQKVDFKVRKAVGHSSEFERIELWSSDGGLIRRCKFDEPEPVKAPAEKPKEQIKKV